MTESDAIRSSVGNITVMFFLCAVIFGALIIRLLPKLLSTAYESSDAETPPERVAVSLKMIALTMAVPAALILAVIFGEFPILWRASPLWCSYIGSLVVALAALVLSLFWLDREQVEEYTIEFDQRAALDRKMKKEDAAMRVVFMGFGLWMIGFGASYLWLLHLASMSLIDVLRWL
jgi:hypothetical protein